VQASDFAIPEFQCLWRLLFVHGRWSYNRIADMILYFFYKNMVFTIPQFYFGFICAFTARAVFDDFYITFYNMIFTALPLALRAITDQDINYKYLQKTDHHYEVKKRINIRKYLPKLYYVGQKNKIFTIGHFTYYILLGLIHSALIFIICQFGVADKMINSAGDVADFWIYSITFYTCVIFVRIVFKH
jgi:phospholipid-transporting ATPase